MDLEKKLMEPPDVSDRHAGPLVDPDRAVLRLGAFVAIAGVVLQILVAQLHAGRADPNDSAAVFPEYAASPIWTAVHIGQLAGTLLISLGLLAFARLVAREPGVTRAFALAGAIMFLLVSATFIVQMAVDGVVLRESISAWEAAAPADKPLAFLIAETVRWLEKSLSASFHLLNGIGLILLGLGLLASRVPAKWLGILGVVGGAGFVYGGWVTAHAGFSAAAGSVLGIATLVGAAFVVGGAVTMIRAASRSTP